MSGSPVRTRGQSVAPAKSKAKDGLLFKRASSQPPTSTRQRFGEFLFSSIKALSRSIHADDPSAVNSTATKTEPPNKRTKSRSSIFESEVIGEISIPSSHYAEDGNSTGQKTEVDDCSNKMQAGSVSGHTWDNPLSSDLSETEVDGVPSAINIAPSSPSADQTKMCQSKKETIDGEFRGKGNVRRIRSPSPATGSNVSALSDDMMFRRIKAAGITGKDSQAVSLPQIWQNHI